MGSYHLWHDYQIDSTTILSRRYQVVQPNISYLLTLAERHSISQSISRKGISLDNGSMEGFFVIFKREMFFNFEKQFKNLNELEGKIRDNIKYYNQKRIKIKLKGLTPIEYRRLVLS